MTTNGKIRDEYLDDAAAEAIGAGQTVSDANASPEEKKAARELRETVARMAAASPYMNPPSDLRGKILAATAPATFKMEDYKKATREDARWWRYGLVAATLFLVAAAYWNMNLQSVVKTRDAQVAALSQAVTDQNKALALIADPKAEKAAIRGTDGKVLATALLDETAGTAVVIAPSGAFPSGKLPVLEITRNGQKKSYRTIAVYVNGDKASPGEFAAGKRLDVKFYNPEGEPAVAGFGSR